MHERIYQLSKTIMHQDEYMTEEDFFDNNFLGSIGDSVSSIQDRDDEIEQLKNNMLNIFKITKENNEYKIKLTNNGKINFFKSRYSKIKNLISNLTIEQFCQDSIAYEICSLTNDKYASYIYINGNYQKIDTFIRNMKPDEEYYIGGILDYHM